MKTTAIICEYNPLTNGHVMHLKLAKEETKADTILCVMSGSFTQRGDAAITDKYLRAEQAILHGADIVLELPTIYAISPADNFAYGAIKTISTFPNVKYVSFGSECGDIEKLTKIANLLCSEPKEFKSALQTLLKTGLSFPQARSLALKQYSQLDNEYKDLCNILDHPNNVLGITYIIAAKKLNFKIKFHTIQRIGSDFNSDDLSGEMSSSSAVRRAVKDGNFKELQNNVPESTYDMLRQHWPQDDELGSLVLFKLKSMDATELEQLYDVSGGIHNRLLIAAMKSSTYENMLAAAKTKNFTMARLKRICLYALFDIYKEDYTHALSTPAFAQILAINSTRKTEILSEYFKNSKNILTRYSDISKVDKSLRPLIKLDFKAQGTLSVINKTNYLNKKMLIVEPLHTIS